MTAGKWPAALDSRRRGWRRWLVVAPAGRGGGRQRPRRRDREGQEKLLDLGGCM